MIPLWKATQDIVDLICIPLRGEQAECGSGTTQMVTADPSQILFLAPPGKLNR